MARNKFIDLIKAYIRFVIFHRWNKVPLNVIDLMNNEWLPNQTNKSQIRLFDYIKKLNGYCPNKHDFKIKENEGANLPDLGKKCFSDYAERLFVYEYNDRQFLEAQFNIYNTFIIKNLSQFNPINYSHSLTNEPSLHFFVRIDNSLSLFIEVFAKDEDGNKNGLVLNQIKKDKKTIFEERGNLKICGNMILDVIKSNVTKVHDVSESRDSGAKLNPLTNEKA